MEGIKKEQIGKEQEKSSKTIISKEFIGNHEKRGQHQSSISSPVNVKQTLKGS